jgi:hypothetical protein
VAVPPGASAHPVQEVGVFATDLEVEAIANGLAA